MKRIVSATDVVALILAALLIWAGQDNAGLPVFSIITLVFAGMLLGVAVNKIAVRWHRAHRPAKAKK